MSCRLFMHHFRSANNRFVCLDIGTTFAAYFTRLVHKDFSHSRTSSGTRTRSYSTTAEPTKCTEHGAIQKGSVQCTVGRVSISCLLYTTLYRGNCIHLQHKILTSSVLILVSLMTMTAICVDRLLALLLGLRYKQIVTLKRTYIIVTTFWVLLLSPL